MNFTEIWQQLIENVPTIIAGMGGSIAICASAVRWYSKILENRINSNHKLELDKKFADYEMKISKLIEDHKTLNEKYLHENKEVFNQKFSKIQELPVIFDEVQDIVIEIIGIINDEDSLNIKDLKFKEQLFIDNRKKAKTICSSSRGFISEDMYEICQNTEQHFDKIDRNLKMYTRCLDKSSNIITIKTPEEEKLHIYDIQNTLSLDVPFSPCELCESCELKEDSCDAFADGEIIDGLDGTILCIKKITKTINLEITIIKNLVDQIHTKKKEYLQNLEVKK